MKNVLIILLLSFVLFSCKKSAKTVMPLPTDIDTLSLIQQNTMICYVNGELRSYTGKPTLFKPDGVSYYRYGNDSSIYFTGDVSKYRDRIELEIFTWDIKLTKVYSLGNGVRRDYGCYIRNSATEFRTHLNTGYVIFTKCDDASIIGKFAFTGYTKDSQKVEVTDGYFNIDSH